MNRNELWLTRLLRLGGVITGSAVFTLFLPEAWMASTHRALGLGEFPAAPITGYLARSVSAMYAYHGALLLALSTDVRRHLRAIRWLGWATLAMGLALIGIDLKAGLPSWWLLLEGPWVAAIGVVIVLLCRRVDAS
jgi:hypothetical protein